MQHNIAALYVHIPFCEKKCFYCDFASLVAPTGDARVQATVETMVRQLEYLAHKNLFSRLQTAFVGGGTPSLAPAASLERLLTTIAALPDKKSTGGLQELSVEANPEHVRAAFIDLLAQSGATRLSCGVQSFNDQELLALGRIHSAKRAYEALCLAAQTLPHVSLDLMCALLHQTPESFGYSLERALQTGVDHMSIYPLQIEEQTVFGKRYPVDPDWNSEELQARYMKQAEEALTAAGYSRYEVASYAKPGAASKHNQMYWTGASYLGLGPSAASCVDVSTWEYLRTEVFCQADPAPVDTARVRFTITTPINRYAQTPLDELELSLEFLSAREAVAEDLMLGMRMSKGAGPELVARLDELTQGAATKTLHTAEEKGLVTYNPQNLRWQPSERGWLMGNELFGMIWDLAEV